METKRRKRFSLLSNKSIACFDLPLEKKKEKKKNHRNSIARSRQSHFQEIYSFFFFLFRTSLHKARGIALMENNTSRV